MPFRTRGDTTEICEMHAPSDGGLGVVRNRGCTPRVPCEWFAKIVETDYGFVPTRRHWPYDRRIPIVVFEITSRRLLQILLIGPLSVLAMFLLLPKILRAYSWRGALWFLPATFTYTWDGFVSCLRSYTLRELESMTRTLSDRYHWRIGFLPTKIPGTRITYLTGAAQAPGC